MRIINLIIMLVSLTVIAAFGLEAWRVLRGQRRMSFWFALSTVIFPLFGGATFVLAFKAKPIPVGGLWGFLAFNALILFLLLRKSFTKPSTDYDDQILRGSALVSGSDTMTTLYGKKTVKKVKTAPHRAEFIQLGEVVVPYTFEAQHLLFSGATGSGFVSRFFKPGDHIFNPFDSRSVDWSPFAEIRAEYDCARIAKAAIPDGNGDGQEWHHYAQTLLSETMLALIKQDQRSIKTLLYYLTSADSKELGELLTGTPAGILCVKGNDKMLANTRGIISTYLVAWRYLADQGQFSVRQWVQDEDQTRWLFVTFRDNQLGLLRLLVATILELATVEGLSLSENPERDLWFIMDEVDSLGKVTSLRAGLTNRLNQATQIRLQSRPGTANHRPVPCHLRPRRSPNPAGQYFHQSHPTGGRRRNRRLLLHRVWRSRSHPDAMVANRGYSQGTSIMNPGTASNSTSNTQIREHKRTILASEIAGLPDLCGFLKLPGVPIGTIQLQYEKLPAVTPAYQESGRALLKPSPSQVQNPDPIPS